MAMLSVMTPVTYAMQWKEDWMSVHVVNNILVTNPADWSHNLNHLLLVRTAQSLTDWPRTLSCQHAQAGPYNQQLLEQPRVSIKFGKRSRSYRAPITWNSLPLKIRLSPTLETFKCLFKNSPIW